MVAKRKRQAQRQTGIQKTENFPANNMNEKMLTSIITNALLEYDKRKEQEAQEKAETEQASFTQRVGYKDYSAEKQPKRIIKSFFNRAKVFFNILFMRSRNIKGTRATFLLIKMFTYIALWLASISLFCASLFFIACVPLQYILTNVTPMSWYGSCMLVLVAFITFIFAQLFRMAKIEIDKLNDFNLIFGLFTSILSIFSVIIAIIAIVK